MCARRVGATWAVMEKERPAQAVAEIGYVVGDVKGKTAVLVDDMIATAGTLTAAAQTALDEGAARALSDTIPLRRGPPDNITVLSTAGTCADPIRRIFTDDSVSEIFAGENQLF